MTLHRKLGVKEQTRRREAAIKRSIDLVVGIVLVLVVLPVIAVLAVGVALSLRTWPFFLQDRIGRDGRSFRFLKLRTLPRSAPVYATKYALDTRTLPWFPRMLRRRHLDELPQLFLVVTGRMSLVGPRPEQPDQAEGLEPGFARRRASVRPGCTGLWQISHRSVGLIAESPAYDELYVAERSLRLDAWILLRTLWLFAAPRRMVDLDDIPSWAMPVPAAAALGGLAAAA